MTSHNGFRTGESARLFLFGAALAVAGSGCQSLASDQETSARTEPTSGNRVELTKASAGTPVGASLSPQSQTVLQTSADWHRAMTKTPLPSDGCFEVSYPNTTWQSRACGPARNVPFPPGPRQRGISSVPAGSGAQLNAESASPQSVGNGNDLIATLTNTTSATGDFLSANNVTSETDSTTGHADSYSLQINTNTFTSAACAGHSSCIGWQQYIFETNTSGAWVYMQYWMIRYNATCPSGWNTYSPIAGETDCWKNSSTTSVTQQTAATLIQLKLSGSAGTQDVSTVFTGNNTLSATGAGSVLSLAGNWSQSEFNVVGDGNGGQAIFNANATMVVSLNVNNGGTSAPTCSGGGTTGETNSLSLVSGSCCALGGAFPSIVFTQTNTGSTFKPYCPQMSYIPTLALLR
jgi:hypothetical protein